MKKFLLAFMMKDIEIFIMLLPDQKILIFHDDMPLWNWYFIRRIKYVVWIASFKAFFSEFWFTKFKIYLLLEFLRYLLAVFGVLKVVHCKIENFEPNFDFLISTFLWLFYWSCRRRLFSFLSSFEKKISEKSPNQKSDRNFISANLPPFKHRKPLVNILKTLEGDRFWIL